MKTKLNLPAVIIFVLAATMRVEAGGDEGTIQYRPSYIDRPLTLPAHFFGAPGDCSNPVGAPKLGPQGNVDVACGTGDANANLYFGAISQCSGFVPDVGNWNGVANLTVSIPYVFGTSPGDANYASTGMAIGDVNGDGIPDMCVAGDGGGVNGVGALDILSTTSTHSTPQAIVSLIANYGTDPSGVMIAPDGSIFLTCQSGGMGNGGSLLKILANTTILVDFLPFYSAMGSGPVGTVVSSPNISTFPSVQMPGAKPLGIKANNSSSTNYTLYGVTSFGGTNVNVSSGFGTVYKVNDDGSGFQTLYVFSYQRATNGYQPEGGMALSGNTLYGTTSGGGKNGSGTVFKMDTSGSNFMVLKSFSAGGTQIVNGYYTYTNADGMAPEGDLIVSGDTLYGTTLEGGTNGGGGVVYSINTNGGSFTLLHSFSYPTDNGTGTGTYTNSDGGGTRAGLLLTGHVLYGTTPYGGSYGGGTLFAIILPTPPFLNIAPSGGSFTVSWPSAATNFMLQQNFTLDSQTWSNFTGTVNDDGTNKSVSVISAAGYAFFRLLSTNGF